MKKATYRRNYGGRSERWFWVDYASYRRGWKWKNGKGHGTICHQTSVELLSELLFDHRLHCRAIWRNDSGTFDGEKTMTLGVS